MTENTGKAGLADAVQDLTDATRQFKKTIDQCTYVDAWGYEYNYVRKERVVGPAELSDGFEEFRGRNDGDDA